MMSDIRVADSREAECAEASGCTLVSGGIGIAAFAEGTASVDRFDLSQSALCGALVAYDGQLVLTRGRISDSPIGICIQVPGFDIEQIRREVEFVRNDTNLDTTDLPVPALPPPAPE